MKRKLFQSEKERRPLFSNPEGWLVCDGCKQTKADVKATNCPFAADVHDEVVPMNLCDDCWQERADDI